MKVKIESEQELISVCEEALHIIANIRKFTKLWEQEFGVELKTKKKRYEQMADELIERLQVPEHRRVGQIKIEVNGSDKIS
jgi:hypothetical protein